MSNEVASNELSPDIGQQIKRLTKVAHGHQQTMACELKDGRNAFVKSNRECCYEAKVLSSLAAMPDVYVPEVIAYSSEPPTLLLEAIDGVHLESTELTEHLQNIAEAMFAFHRCSIPDYVHRVSIADYLQQQPFEQLPLEQRTKVLDKLDELKLYRFSTESQVWLHGDLNKFNVLWDGNRFCFIDWEYSFAGDERWDLASIAIEYELTAECTKDLLQAYAKASNNSKVDADFDKWRLAYVLICLGWSLANDQPYDTYWRQFEMLDTA